MGFIGFVANLLTRPTNGEKELLFVRLWVRKIIVFIKGVKKSFFTIIV
jgi:hypothetical protein